MYIVISTTCYTHVHALYYTIEINEDSLQITVWQVSVKLAKQLSAENLRYFMQIATENDVT